MDYLTFNLPDSLEDFLFSTVVVREQLLGMRMACGSCRGSHQACTHSGTKYQATVRRSPAFECLARPLLYDCRRVSEFDRETLDHADVVLSFDRERAYALSRANRQHAVSSFGVLAGAAPRLKIPTLGERLVPKQRLILWLPRHATDWRSEVAYGRLNDFLTLLSSRVAPYGASVRALQANTSIEDAWEAISSSSICVGVVGGLTALAASIGRPLVEVYPPSLFHQGWSAKWGQAYAPINLEPDLIPPERLAEVVESLAAQLGGQQWAHRTSHTSHRAVAA